MDEGLNDSEGGGVGITLRSLASSSPSAFLASSSSSGGGGGGGGGGARSGKASGKARQPHLWVLVLPLIIGLSLVSLFEFYSTLEVVRESHLSVFTEAAHNGVGAIIPHLDGALVGSRAVNAYFRSREAAIGTTTADRPLLDMLAAFPGVSALVVGVASGAVSAAGKFQVRHAAVWVGAWVWVGA